MNAQTLRRIRDVLVVLLAIALPASAWMYGRTPSLEQPASRTTIPIAAPDSINRFGHRLGRPGARVTIVEFSDFECPVCRRMKATLDSVLHDYPELVSVRYRHFPLQTIHPYARIAAIASVCADDQGRFQAMYDRLFARQSAFAVGAWTRWAAEAGVADTARFSKCLGSERADSIVRRDRRDGDAIQISGTPTLVINDRLLQFTPSYAELVAYIGASSGRSGSNASY